MKFRRTNKVGKFEVKKVKNKGAVCENVVRVAILYFFHKVYEKKSKKSDRVSARARTEDLSRVRRTW